MLEIPRGYRLPAHEKTSVEVYTNGAGAVNHGINLQKDGISRCVVQLTLRVPAGRKAPGAVGWVSVAGNGNSGSSRGIGG